MFREKVLKVRSIFSYCMGKYFIDWVKNELNKGPLSLLRSRLSCPLELSGLSVEVVISPEDAFEDIRVNSWKFRVIFSSHELGTEDESIFGCSKDDIIQGG